MKSTTVFFSLLSLAAAAGATDVGQHPAVFSPRSLPGIDASTFIPGHPAGGKSGMASAAVVKAPVAAAPAPKATDDASAVTRVSAARDTAQAATSRQ